MRESKVIPVDKIKDVLITKTAIKLLKPEQVIEKVIAFQFKDAMAHTKIANEVEISGFGKFYVSKVKVKRKLKILGMALDKVNRELENPERVQALTPKKETIILAINYLKGKLDESGLDGNSGGIEEQADTSQGIEGDYRSGSEGEDGNMQLLRASEIYREKT